MGGRHHWVTQMSVTQTVSRSAGRSLLLAPWVNFSSEHLAPEFSEIGLLGKFELAADF